MVDGDSRRRDGKRVLVVCQLDRYANGLKPRAMEAFLRERGHDVHLVDTYYLSRACGSRSSFGSKLPSLRPKRAALYATEIARMLLTRPLRFGRRLLSYQLLVADYRLRSAILASSLPLDAFDLVICETPYDAWLLTAPTGARTWYDCPCPWSDELFYEGLLTRRQHDRLRQYEARLFEAVDHLSFHWPSYTTYALQQYGISGHNLTRLDFGCSPPPYRAAFDQPLRIVYMGNLTARFNNPGLLSRLARQYPHIDVYGGPRPDPQLGLNYRGYSPSLDVLGEYQLGLVTCSQDPLRRQGFSSKHINYLSYGLPVLVPSWRRHLDLLQGSVPYTEQSFRSIIDSLADESRWRSFSDEAYSQAQRLYWDNTLQPLQDVLVQLP